MQANVRTDFWQQVVPGKAAWPGRPIKAAMARRVTGRPYDLELSFIDRKPLGTFEERIGLDNRYKFTRRHRSRLHELGFCRGNAVLARPIGNISHEILGTRVARFHERDFEAMDHQLRLGAFAQLAGNAEVVGVDVRDEDPLDPTDRDF